MTHRYASIHSIYPTCSDDRSTVNSTAMFYKISPVRMSHHAHFSNLI